MAQLLPLSRAARLAGVTRGELQKRLRDEGIETFEGKITVTRLLSLYPDADLESDPVFERIQKIKADARPKRDYTDGLLPEPEVLMTRLKEVNAVLTRTKSSLNYAEQVLKETLQRLAHARSLVGATKLQATDELRDWLEHKVSTEMPHHDARAALFARDAFLKVLAPSVRVLSTGHEFFVEGRDSLLEAGLKAGLHLQYGCASGNCGACKARLISGKATQIRPHDYVLGAREREAGYLLACSWTAVTDLVIEAIEARTPAELPIQEVRAGVDRIERLADDVAILRLVTPRTNTLRFMAGQSVTLTDEDDNSAAYPLASCPCDGRHLQFFVRRREGNRFSAAVFDGSLATQVVHVQGPYGDFVLREDNTAPIVFVATGDGIAPIKSLVEHAISIDTAPWMHLYLVDDAPWLSNVCNLCRSWHDALDHFRFTLLPAGTTVPEIVDAIGADHADVASSLVYVAGPPARVEELAADIRRLPDCSEGSPRVMLCEV
ncbi:MAG: 2Fe-2S iron-sulfur cluster-binding protein [Gammaproteobacteria bacterium]|jgi:CDP-4-dehydro-6-deoxyglucose reductase|nr:2Fe-2S iron-sulfur cluster-binding protein [Gammaproteobacteria bacterium]